jgi:hypothetical protein
MLEKPKHGSYNEYYETYIGKVESNNILDYLEDDLTNKHITFIRSLTADQLRFRYAENKWSVSEVIGHIIDCERIFTYRALTFARGDKTSLPGFEEDNYAQASNYNQMDQEQLIQLYSSNRRASAALFRSFTNAMWQSVGLANGSPMITSAIPFINAGHELHHFSIIKERYLK